MHTIFAVVIALTASATPGLSKSSDRAARLMNEEERAQLESFDLRLVELQPSAGQSALRVSSIVVLAAGVAVPVVLGAVGLLGGLVIGGFIALVTGASWGTWIGIFMLGVFSWVPIWGWVTMAAVALIGGGMLVGSIVSDAPRRQQVQAVKQQRREFIRVVNELHRNDPPMVEAPPITLLTF